MATYIPPSQAVDTQDIDKPSPRFDHRAVTVIFVLGGPGSGKGTQCALLVKDFNFCHLSAGDLLRTEQNREHSQYGNLIRTCIREGTIVPMEVTIKLLQKAMEIALQESRGSDTWSEGRGRFLIDGFPRKMDQALGFEQQVCASSLILHYSATEEVMLDRLMERGKTSGREDDNIESIKKRFRTHQKDTMPVIDYYKTKGKVAEIDASGTVDEIHEKTQLILRKLFTSASNP